jgi:peptidoglycan/LPS O-acetylase OafA/YrhL
MTVKPLTPRDVPNLDLVRSMAVISVVIEHILLALKITQVGPFPITYFGVIGVFLFYVLTALVLMWSLERKPHTLDFYIRRFFRIYPLAILTLLIAIAFHAPVAGTPTSYFQYQHPGLFDFIIQSALMQDLITAPHTICGVMWSLPYEVQMYLVLPILFFFVRRNFSLWPLLLLFGLILLNARRTPSYTHNFTVAAGYFLPGVMAYIGFARWKPRLPAWLLPLFLIALWALMLPRMNFHHGWIFCLIVGLSLPLFRQFDSRWVTRPSAQIAKYSYGIYLMHPFAIVVGIYLLRAYSLPIQLLGVLIPLIVLPIFMYHAIEHPMIRFGSHLARRAVIRFEQSEPQQLPDLPLP